MHDGGIQPARRVDTRIKYREEIIEQIRAERELHPQAPQRRAKKRKPQPGDTVTVTVKLPVNLHRILVRSSQRNRRSVGNEAIVALEKYLIKQKKEEEYAPFYSTDSGASSGDAPDAWSGIDS